MKTTEDSRFGQAETAKSIWVKTLKAAWLIVCPIVIIILLLVWRYGIISADRLLHGTNCF